MHKDYIEQLYQRYYDRLMVVALSFTHDRSMAEDLVHDTFVKAILSYNSGGSFLAWCIKVLKNAFYDLCRRDRFIAEQSVEDLDIDAGVDLLEEFIRSENKARLATEISNLPIRQREVMIATVYLEAGDEEIAADMGISRENVRQLRSRARKSLMERMKK